MLDLPINHNESCSAPIAREPERPMARQPQQPELDAAQRLILIRMAEGEDNQAAFAQRLGIEPRRYNNFERGLPLSKDVAFKLVKAIPGLTTDYVWLGNMGGLTVELRRRLTAAARKLAQAAARPRKGRTRRPSRTTLPVDGSDKTGT